MGLKLEEVGLKVGGDVSGVLGAIYPWLLPVSLFFAVCWDVNICLDYMFSPRCSAQAPVVKQPGDEPSKAMRENTYVHT